MERVYFLFRGLHLPSKIVIIIVILNTNDDMVMGNRLQRGSFLVFSNLACHRGLFNDAALILG